MPCLRLSEKQLRLVQSALDFYSRVGIGQMNVIKEHPTFEGALRNLLRPKKDMEVGDKTEQGEVVKITKNRVQTRGRWGAKEELRWFPRSEVRHSVDYEKFHLIRDAGDRTLNMGRNMLLGESMPYNGSYGIHSPSVDETCREAFDIVQVIRHEFWKANPNRSDITVDSSIHFISTGHNVKCEL